MIGKILFLAVVIGSGMFAFSGCDTVGSKLDVPEGRNSANDRYQDDDIIGPVLKLRLKESPEQQKSQQDLLRKQTIDPNY